MVKGGMVNFGYGRESSFTAFSFGGLTPLQLESRFLGTSYMKLV